MAFPEIVFPTSAEFLQFFKKIGCYLDDLSLIPVNDRNADGRKRMQLEGMPSLAKRIADYQPNVIVCMLKDKAFQTIIKEAVRRAGFEGVPFRVTPFGGFGNQGKYREELKKHLLEFQCHLLF